ncbi:MAG: ABC transporter ATP-binding protein [Defluviitaleaceae bacterium]|nr:ABC transporter ATP-binding protein [Defluviitaleaceae bacterium]
MIEVRNLSKRYGTHLAVDNISFTAGKGEIVGLLGPNGAGKTTTMNILTGYISATNGDVTINGKDILDNPAEAKTATGYLPDAPPLYNNMLVDEYLRFVCQIKKVAGNARKKMIADIKEMVRITAVGKRVVGNLSKGYRQRVGLAQALIGYPQALIMDEPTNGFDPGQIIEMREVIKGLGKNRTLIVSSHILPEIQALCDRVLIMHKGRLAASDTASGLSASLAKGLKITVRIRGVRDDVLKAFNKESVFKSVTPLASREEGTVDIEITGGEGMDVRDAIFYCASRNSLPILSMNAAGLSLEEIFMQVISGGDAPDAGDI